MATILSQLEYDGLGPIQSNEVVADLTARNAIPNTYNGLIVYVEDSDGAGTPQRYEVINETLTSTDAGWAEFTITFQSDDTKANTDLGNVDDDLTDEEKAALLSKIGAASAASSGTTPDEVNTQIDARVDSWARTNSTDLIDEANLDTSVNDSLDLADSALQNGDVPETYVNAAGNIVVVVPSTDIRYLETTSFDSGGNETLTLGDDISAANVRVNDVLKFPTLSTGDRGFLVTVRNGGITTVDGTVPQFTAGTPFIVYRNNTGAFAEITGAIQVEAVSDLPDTADNNQVAFVNGLGDDDQEGVYIYATNTWKNIANTDAVQVILTTLNDGSNLSDPGTAIEFTDSRITTSISGLNGRVLVDTSGITTGGAAITVQEEGVDLTTAAETLNFVGSAVTATGDGATKTITITGGTGGDGGVADAIDNINESETPDIKVWKGTIEEFNARTGDELDDTAIYITTDTVSTVDGGGAAAEAPFLPSSIPNTATDTTATYILQAEDASDVETYSWVTFTDNDTTYNAATPGTDGTDGTDGLMSDADKFKLDGIEDGAEVNNLPDATPRGGLATSPDAGKLALVDGEGDWIVSAETFTDGVTALITANALSPQSVTALPASPSFGDLVYLSQDEVLSGEQIEVSGVLVTGQFPSGGPFNPSHSTGVGGAGPITRITWSEGRSTWTNHTPTATNGQPLAFAADGTPFNFATAAGADDEDWIQGDFQSYESNNTFPVFTQSIGTRVIGWYLYNGTSWDLITTTSSI